MSTHASTALESFGPWTKIGEIEDDVYDGTTIVRVTLGRYEGEGREPRVEIELSTELAGEDGMCSYRPTLADVRAWLARAEELLAEEKP